MNRKTSLALALAASLAAVSGSALAQSNGRIHEDARDLPEAKISIIQAIEAAQKHHSGSKAVDADLDRDGGRVHFDVSVVAPDNRVYDVVVDAVDGKVLDSREDHDD
ncbi:MAG: PepSY domain-containing protein [Lautropia sp.]|nr:PepSY domain-containing protein [Lautropia sp.]